MDRPLPRLGDLRSACIARLVAVPASPPSRSLKSSSGLLHSHHHRRRRHRELQSGSLSSFTQAGPDHEALPPPPIPMSCVPEHPPGRRPAATGCHSPRPTTTSSSRCVQAMLPIINPTSAALIPPRRRRQRAASNDSASSTWTRRHSSSAQRGTPSWNPFAPDRLAALGYHTFMCLDVPFHVPQRYTFLRELGVGSYGCVVLAHDAVLNVPVAYVFSSFLRSTFPWPEISA